MVINVTLRRSSTIKALSYDGVGNPKSEKLGVLKMSERVRVDATSYGIRCFSVPMKQSPTIRLPPLAEAPNLVAMRIEQKNTARHQ